MSVPLDAVSERVRAREAWAAKIVIVVGTAVLVLRPFATPPSGARVSLFAVSYLTIGLASIAVPTERDRARLAPGFVLLMGFAAVALSAGVAGTEGRPAFLQISLNSDDSEAMEVLQSCAMPEAAAGLSYVA